FSRDWSSDVCSSDLHEAERWATPCYEWLAARDDVLPDRVGVIGISLGGYFAPRAAAFEPRFAAGVSWGANHNWAEVQRRRLQREIGRASWREGVRRR